MKSLSKIFNKIDPRLVKLKKNLGAFDLYDIDQSGSIDRAEMAEIFTSINKMRGEVSNDECIDEKVEKIFAKIDADGNGEISKEEFLEGVKDEQSIVEAFSVYKNLS